MSFILGLGAWSLRLHSATPSCVALVNRLSECFNEFVYQGDGMGELCSLAIASPPLECGMLLSGDLLEEEMANWPEFCRDLRAAYNQFLRAHGDGALGDRGAFTYFWPEGASPLLNSFPDLGRVCYLGLVLENLGERSHFQLLFYLLWLATSWHLQHGGLCLHSAAVARDGDGFIFLGQSGAGKTTVTSLSAELGYPGLGDDLNFILPDGNGGYRLAAAPSPSRSPVGYSMLRPAFRGVLALRQGERDELSPLSPRQAAGALFESFLQQPLNTSRFPDDLVARAFQTCCEIARCAPAYELRFRRSADFWKLIDAQFPPH